MKTSCHFVCEESEAARERDSGGGMCRLGLRRDYRVTLGEVYSGGGRGWYNDSFLPARKGQGDANGRAIDGVVIVDDFQRLYGRNEGVTQRHRE